MATIEAICISKKKGMVKKATSVATFKAGFGIIDDAHAGKWHRQVSLLAGESIDTVKEKLPTLKDGAFAENIITRDLDLSSVSVGDSLQIGRSEERRVGKECRL